MDLLTLMMASNKRTEGGETNTIYIDPSGSNGTGTITSPRNTLIGLTITNGYTYRFKCGTTYTTSTVLDLTGRNGVIFTKYGTGNLPKFSFTGSGTCAVRFAGSTNCIFSFIDIYTDITQSLIAIIQLGTGTNYDGGTGNRIYGCKIHNVKEGTNAGGIGIRGGGTNLSIINNEVYDCGDDGMYLANTVNLEVAYNHIYNVSQNYAGLAKGFLSIGTGSLGDCIQMGGTWPGFYIHHNTLERLDAWTGNKFAIIFNSAIGINATNGGIFEHNIVKTKLGSDISYAIYGEQGNGIIIRYNYIKSLSNGGVRVTGLYCLNYAIYSNIFVDCNGSAVAVVNYLGGYPTDTLVYNNVCARGTSIYAYVSINGGNAIVRNNIFDGALNSFYAAVGATYTRTHNCHQNPVKIGTGGLTTGEITGDPLFVDSANDDFHLQLTSACINAGVDVGITEDYDGSSITSLNLGVYF